MQLRGTPDLGRFLGLPVALVALGVTGIVAWAALTLGRAVGITAVSLLLFGFFQLGRGLRVLGHCRRRADDWLRTATGVVVPPAYAWRAAQLTSPRRRRMLARTLRLIEESARDRPFGGNRPRLLAVRRRPVALEALARTLDSANEPVTPAGMLRVAELLSAGTGPLWGTSDEALGEEIETTLAVLTPRRLGLRGACAA